jgi:hypothetical protein
VHCTRSEEQTWGIEKRLSYNDISAAISIEITDCDRPTEAPALQRLSRQESGGCHIGQE